MFKSIAHSLISRTDILPRSNVNTGTICSILCRDLISGYDDDVKETSSIPKWILSSSLIRGGLRNSSEENVQSMNDLSSLLVPSGVLKKIWNSHPCLHVASFEVVHTVWSLSFSIFDLKSILSDSQRKKQLAKVCKQVISKVCKALSKSIQSSSKSKDEQKKMYQELSDKVVLRAQRLRNILAPSTTSSSSSSETQKYAIRYCVKDLEENDTTTTLKSFLQKRKLSALGRILSIRIVGQLISQISLAPLRRILLAVVPRGLAFQHYNVNMLGSGCEKDVSDTFFQMCASVRDSCFQNKDNFAEQILASSIVSLPLSAPFTAYYSEDLKSVFDLNLLDALDPLLMSHYTTQSALSRRKWTDDGESNNKIRDDSIKSSSSILENLLSKDDNVLGNWIQQDGDASRLADISVSSNLIALIRKDGRVMSAGRNTFGSCGVGLPSAITKFTDVIGFSEGVRQKIYIHHSSVSL